MKQHGHLRFFQGIFFLFIFSASCKAQFNGTADFKFKTYTTKDGLVHNYTKKCIADHKGFLWIITEHGLSRFDGLNFKNFENIPGDSTSLPYNDLEDIAIDKDDRIWLDYKNGLCFYDQVRHSFTVIRQNKKPVQSFSIVFDSTQNCIWSINYEGYTRIDCRSFSIKIYPYKKQVTTRLGFENAYIDSRNRLWILLDRRGYYTIDLVSNEQYYYDQDIWPMQVYEDEQQQIWMTTWGSGFRKIITGNNIHRHILYEDPFRPKTEPYAEIHYGIAESKALTGDGILWISNSTNGILLFDKTQLKFIRSFNYDANVKNGIATDFNNTMYSKNGIVWICTWHGLTKVNISEQQFNSRELPFLKTDNYNRLSGIVDDPYNRNILWLGAEGSGIIKYDKQLNKPLTQYFNFAGNDKGIEDDNNYYWRWIDMMMVDSKKNIWATTYGGAIEISNGSIKKKPFTIDDEAVFPKKIIEYPAGTLWMATSKGLLTEDIIAGSYKAFQNLQSGKIINSRLNDVVPEDSNHLLVAGQSGAYRFTISGGEYQKLKWHFQELDSADQEYCTCLEKIGTHLYIGTIAGLVDYDLATGRSSRIGIAQGIDKIPQHRLKKDAANNLWIFTSHGLFKYTPPDGSFQEYNTSDGIYDLSEDMIGFFDYDKRFYIGYRMAMTSFDPLEVNVNRTKVDAVITDILVNNNILNKNIDSFVTQALNLSYKQNDLVFDFTGPDFTNSDKITFAYQLKGYDKDWINAGNKRTATYTNLKGGEYIFRVKARNSSGVWNEKEAIAKIKIAIPFWQTIPFYALLIILAALLIYALYKYRVNQLIGLFNVRNTISKNLHDEIGATLSSINIYSDVARKKTSDDTEKNKLLDRIYKASSQVMDSMNDIVWYVNPKNDSWDNIIVRMREYAIPLLESKNIHPDFTIDESILKYKLTMQQRQHVYFIFKEAINNIVKYAAASKVIVTLERNDKNLLLLIADDGKGFTTGTIRPGNGLANMRQRAEMLNGQFSIASETGKGTIITLRVKIT